MASNFKSNAEKVKEFTQESMGVELPNTPHLMNRDQVLFISKMIMSEVVELLQTVKKDDENVLDLAHNCIGTDLKLNYEKPNNIIKLIGEQYDAFVDIMYYSYNCAAKNGVNLDKIFDIVHDANMNKKFSDGKFHKREDGKIIKPDNYKEADVDYEINRQIEHGAFN